MITLHEKIDVNRPLHEALRYLADFRTAPEWGHSIAAARKLTRGPVANGTRFEVVCRHPLGRLSVHYTLTRLDEAGVISLHGTNRYFSVDDLIHLSETATGTRIDYRTVFRFNKPLCWIEERLRGGLEETGRMSAQRIKRALDDHLPAPCKCRNSERGEKLLLPAVFDFTRFGFRHACKRFQPMSRSMLGKHIVITDASSGIGLATARRLAESGAQLTLVIRDESKALGLQRALERESGNPHVHLEVADLSRMAEVDRLVRRLRRLDRPVDVLVNNTGAPSNSRRDTGEGLEYNFALSLLSPYRLTCGLKPLLDRAGTARVINVLATGMYTQALSLEHLEAPPQGYSGGVACARAKRALMVVTREWARQWRQDGIVVNAMHPGWVSTPEAQTTWPRFQRLARPVLRTPEQGADTIIWLAVASEAALCSGELFLDREPRAANLLASTRESPEQCRQLMTTLAHYVGAPPHGRRTAGIAC